MESSGMQKLSAAIFLHPVPGKACRFGTLQKTASLNFCALTVFSGIFHLLMPQNLRIKNQQRLF